MRETLAAQPYNTEQFDRYQRTYNDTTTWLAETLDGFTRTPFEYKFDGHELIAEDGGKLAPIFEDAITDAEEMVRNNLDLSFELRRRRLELAEYEAMIRMALGTSPNTMVVVSDFPAELIEATSDVGGYNVARKQTMLRVLSWDGYRLRMHSQSLDGSDRAALEAIYENFGITPRPGELLGQRIEVDLPRQEQEHLTDRLTGIYDRRLASLYGGHYYAGRPEVPTDTYQFVLSQDQLVDRFVQAELHGNLGEDERYNIAALIAKRFEAYKQPAISIEQADIVWSAMSYNLDRQLLLAGAEARAEGRVFNGCGVSAGPGSVADQLHMAGYSNTSNSDEDKFGPLEFKCKNGHTNRRPRGQLITECKVSSCKDSVAC